MFIENYISTGILELNRVMQGGFKRGETCVISGARESSYESFFISVTSDIARSDNRVLFISNNLSRELIQEYYASNFCNIDFSKIRTNNLTSYESELLDDFYNALSNFDNNIIIEEKEDMTLVDILDCISKHFYLNNINVVSIPNIESILGANGQNGLSRDECNLISDSISSLCKKYNITLLVGAPISNKAASRSIQNIKADNINMPTLLIEKARQVIYLYRDELYNENTTRPGMVDIIFLKNKMGYLESIECILELKYHKILST